MTDKDEARLFWRRQVQVLLEEPELSRPGFRCSACGRLRLIGDPYVECGGEMVTVSDVYEEAVEDAIEQSAHVRYWGAPPFTRSILSRR